MAEASLSLTTDNFNSDLLHKWDVIASNKSKRKGKRQKNPSNWKKEKRKRAIISGQAYLNTKGDLVGPRIIGPDCNCKYKCFGSVSSENRLAIFNGYYSLKR